MITTAFVKIWGEMVGAVAWNQKTELGSFEYAPNFKKLGWDLAPLKMPIGTSESIFSFPEMRANRNSEFDTFKGLPGLLADVLPDKYGNQLLDAWLAQNGRAPGSLNPVETLCFIGRRGMGAIEFEPAQFAGPQNVFEVEINSLVDIAQQMLSKRQQFKTNIAQNDKQAMLDILKIGTSAGGARPKAVIAYNEDTGEVKSGQGLTPDGFEQWMIKLDGVSDEQFGKSVGFGRVEMAYYEMAIESGIEMMQCKLLEENGRAHFMTKRFDREGANTKHHIQTFCAMEHFDFNNVLSYSYEQLFQTMRKLKLDYPDAEQMFRRMVFNVVARNCDDHTKNFSFRLKENEEWRLSPGYDICHAYRPDSIWVSQHALSVNGKRKGITKSDLLAVAESMNIKKAEPIVNHISNVVDEWSSFAADQSVSKDLTESIQKTLIKLS